MLVVLVVLLVAAIGSSRALGDSKHRGIRLLARTSLFFLILGTLIGPSGLALISADSLVHLSPIVVIGLGRIGFLYATHLEYRDLRRFSPRLFGTAFGEALITFVLVGGVYFLFAALEWIRWDPIAFGLLASTAACTATVEKVHAARGRGRGGRVASPGSLLL